MLVFPLCVGVKHGTNLTFGISSRTLRFISGRIFQGMVDVNLWVAFAFVSIKVGCYSNTVWGLHLMGQVENS